MKVSTSSVEFARAVNTVSRAISKSTNAIMDCIYMSATDSTLFLKASDNNLTIVTSIPAAIRTPGEVVVPVKTLIELVRTYQEGSEIAIEAIERDKVTFRCGTSDISLQSRNPSDYPQIASPAMANFFTVPNVTFRNMVRQTIFACAVSDAFTPILKGMLVESDQGLLRFVAMDGYIMAVRSEPFQEASQVSCVVPSRTMNEVLRILTAYEEDALVNIASGRFIVNVGSTQIISNLLVGDYLNYKSLPPANANCMIKFFVKDLISAAERAHLLREQTTAAALLSVKENTLTLFAQSSEGKVREEVDVAKSGENMSVACDSALLLNLLKVIPDERAVIEICDETSPILFRPVDSDKYLYLLMPIEIPKLYREMAASR